VVEEIEKRREMEEIEGKRGRDGKGKLVCFFKANSG